MAKTMIYKDNDRKHITFYHTETNARTVPNRSVKNPETVAKILNLANGLTDYEIAHLSDWAADVLAGSKIK